MEKSGCGCAPAYPGLRKRALSTPYTLARIWQKRHGRRGRPPLFTRWMKDGCANMFNTTNASRPLAGKRVLVTRAREQAAALNDRLRKLGAIPIEFPIIRIAPPQDW